jgi:hypothetical protein
MCRKCFIYLREIVAVRYLIRTVWEPAGSEYVLVRTKLLMRFVQRYPRADRGEFLREGEATLPG